MSVQRLFREQFIPAPPAQVWEYFGDPRNLNEMTPPDMNFEIISLTPGRMTEGQLIEYRVEFIRGVRSLWLTEIAHVRGSAYFVDEQRIGPYRFWYHEHHFEPTLGGTLMTDRVTYSIGFGPLGDLLNSLWIGKRLKGIFDYRIRKINKLFPARPD
jgi:ligand-binding SRPBCC domain-containing protein